MDKKVFGLIAISALALVGPANAASSVASATTQALAASYFDELLQPLPNAVSTLQKVDEFFARRQGQPVGAGLLLVEHHHHHQNSYQQPGYQGGGDQNGYQGRDQGYQGGDQGGYQGGDQGGGDQQQL